MPAYDIEVTRTENSTDILYTFDYVITDTLYYACENKRHPCMFRLGADVNGLIHGTDVNPAPISRPYLLLPQASTAAVGVVAQDNSEAWDSNISNWTPSPTVKTISDVWGGDRPSIQTMVSNGTARTTKTCILKLSQTVQGCDHMACVWPGTTSSPQMQYYLVGSGKDPGTTVNACASYMSASYSVTRDIAAQRTGDGLFMAVDSDLVIRSTDGVMFTTTEPDIETGGNVIVAAYVTHPSATEVLIGGQIFRKDGTIDSWDSGWLSMTNISLNLNAVYQSVARPSLSDAYDWSITVGDIRDASSLAPLVGTVTVLDYARRWTPNMPVANPPGLTEKIWPAIYRDVTP